MRKALRLTKPRQDILATTGALGYVTRYLLAYAVGIEPPRRDYSLEENLPRLEKHGLLRGKKWGKERVYWLPTYGTHRNPNIEHALEAGRVAVWLARPAGFGHKAFISRGAFVEAGLPVIPDAGVLLPFGDTRHLYLIEYQSRRESERTTHGKVASYRLATEGIRTRFAVDAVWVLFVLDLLRERVAEIAARHCDGWPSFFFCDRETMVKSGWQRLTREPTFFWSGAPGVHALFSNKP